ncbi:hypothetical protein ACQ4M4_15735 [Leptolyngbya sp. AN02str]|uniref:hypothetical protein n=1 Tax=Leptolyngbya sp. AN02str TaxID=3423363 RepID=UPI003D31CD2D
MFNPKDLEVFNLPIGWDRNDALGDVFFPKLGALQAKLNTLIHEIYGINISEHYNISSTPTSSLNPCGWDNKVRRDKEYSLAANDPYEARVCLRTKHKDAQILLKSGKVTNRHFALFGISIGDCSYLQENLGIRLAILFSPYVYFNYDQSVRDQFVELAQSQRLFELVFNLIDEAKFGYLLSYNPDNPKVTACDTAFLDGEAQVLFHPINPIEATFAGLASLVIVGAAAFPLFDSFTRMCRGETTYIDYYERFHRWSTESQIEHFLNGFSVEPLSDEFIWRAEQETRSIFQDIFKLDFKKTRPEWLRSSKGQRLELDGYNEELKLAFEYQGEYHYMDVPMHHQQRSLKEVQKNDALKLKLCSKHGVDLIQVPYWERGNRQFVINALRLLNRLEITQRLA